MTLLSFHEAPLLSGQATADFIFVDTSRHIAPHTSPSFGPCSFACRANAIYNEFHASMPPFGSLPHASIRCRAVIRHACTRAATNASFYYAMQRSAFEIYILRRAQRRFTPLFSHAHDGATSSPRQAGELAAHFSAFRSLRAASASVTTAAAGGAPSLTRRDGCRQAGAHFDKSRSFKPHAMPIKPPTTRKQRLSSFSAPALSAKPAASSRHVAPSGAHAARCSPLVSDASGLLFAEYRRWPPRLRVIAEQKMMPPHYAAFRQKKAMMPGTRRIRRAAHLLNVGHQHLADDGFGRQPIRMPPNTAWSSHFRCRDYTTREPFRQPPSLANIYTRAGTRSGRRIRFLVKPHFRHAAAGYHYDIDVACFDMPFCRHDDFSPSISNAKPEIDYFMQAVDVDRAAGLRAYQARKLLATKLLTPGM